MAMSEALLAEFDQEVKSTRTTLERVPDDRLDWSPHAKSGSMGWLAGHLANIPSWAGLTRTKDELDLEVDGGTLLALRHSVFGVIPAGYRDGLSSGWTPLLARVRRQVETA